MSPSSDTPTKPIEIFISYAPEDRELLKVLVKHLKLMQRQELITGWNDGELLAGEEWQAEVISHLDRAQIILLLVSTDFVVRFADNSYYQDELNHAFKRHEAGEAVVIPVILRSVDWESPPLDKLQVLPHNRVPITRWGDRDEAFSDVAKGIREVVEMLRKTGQSPTTHSAFRDQPAEESPLPPIWNVPYRPNPFFTGRDEILNDLYGTLVRSKGDTSTPLQALIGPAGIGKTQIALAYAYKYSKNYQAILWAKADSRTTLLSDFVAIAEKLELPEKDVQDQNITVAAVKRWMETHTDWLLILDNVNHLSMVNEFIPSVSRGHILLTSQQPTTGNLAQKVEIDSMDLEESMLLLLHRAVAASASLTDVSGSDRNRVREIAKIMEGIPLALELAAAYIKATGCDWSDYLIRYKQTRPSNKLSIDYPEPVAITWELTCEQIKQTHSAPIELLQFCSFLYPEAIPDEIIAQELDSSRPAATYSARSELLKFSLLHYAPDNQAFTLHRTIQHMLRDAMDESTQRQWAQRAVEVINRVFPTSIDFSAWSRSERYLPHIQTLAEYIRQWDIGTPQAVQLLHRTASYLKERTRYSQAVSLSKLALHIQQISPGPDDPRLAQSFNNLADIYHAQGKYSEAESHYQQALMIYIRALGSTHPEVAQAFDNLAVLYKEQGKYQDAEKFFLQALEIRKQTLKEDDPDVATSLNNLALLYFNQGKYREAESFFQRALDIRRQTLKEDDTDIATSLNNLAVLYSAQGKYDRAEQFLRDALAIDTKINKSHPNTARDLNNLGNILEAKGDLANAQDLYKQALSIDERIYGSNHPNVAGDITNIGSIYRKMGLLEEAEELYRRALDIDEQAYGPNHPNIAIRLNNLGIVLQERGDLQGAQHCYERALAIIEAAYGKNHPNAASIGSNLASVLQLQDKPKEAYDLYKRALAIAVATYGLDSPYVNTINRNLDSILQKES